jgi:hypothetical protein
MGGGIWNFVAPFIATPRNYAEVLWKLAGWAFYEIYIVTFLLRDISAIDDAFRSIETHGHLGAFIGTLPAAANIPGAVLALAAAVISQALHLHDRISDLFGIRASFDEEKILFPLAARVGSNLTPRQYDTARSQRRHLMYDVFYRYTSSRADHPLVDKHNIEHALAAWSWFWVCVEGVFFIGLAAIVAFFSRGGILAIYLAAAAALVFVLAVAQHARLARYARPQVEAIAADPTAAAAVRDRFNAL